MVRGWGTGQGRSWKAWQLGTMPAELSQGRACESSGAGRWRPGSPPARVTAAVRAGHGQECHRFCTDTHNLKLAKKNTPLGKCKNTMKKLKTPLTSSGFTPVCNLSRCKEILSLAFISFKYYRFGFGQTHDLKVLAKKRRLFTNCLYEVYFSWMIA